MLRHYRLSATLRSLALAVPLACLPLAVAHCQTIPGNETSEELAGPDPRLDFEAEAAVPGVAPDKVRNVIRNDKTLLTAPDGPWQPVDTEHKALQLLASELATTRAELKKTQELVGDVLKGHRRVNDGSDLPPLPDAEVRVFQMQNTSANDTADKIKRLIGTQPIRVAIDEASNGVIVFGKAEALPQVEQLVIKLEDLAATSKDGFRAPAVSVFAPKAASAPRRTLMLRVFWLADGVEGFDGPEEYLPPAVISSLGKLGIRSPRLVTQAVNSISVEEGADAVTFGSEIPAIIFDQSMRMLLSGNLASTSDNRALADVQLMVEERGPICQVKGSIAAPIGHFMVLGTANSVIAGTEMGNGMEMPTGRGGMGMAMGREGEGGMGMGMGRGGEMGVEAPADAAKFNSTRFAFVVQVVEAESFAPEE